MGLKRYTKSSTYKKAAKSAGGFLKRSAKGAGGFLKRATTKAVEIAKKDPGLRMIQKLTGREDDRGEDTRAEAARQLQLRRRDISRQAGQGQINYATEEYE